MPGNNYGSVYVETYGTTSPATGSAPTTDATDGQPLNGLYAVTPVVSAESGVALSGGGSLLAYLYDTYLLRWVRAPMADIADLSSLSTRDGALGAFVVGTPRNGRIKWVPSGVTFASGSGGVTVTQLGQTYNQLREMGAP